MKTKTPEEIYAQTAAFVDTQPYGYQAALDRKIGEIATPLLAGEPVIVQPAEGYSEEGELTITSADYVEFLRNADAETRADINFLAGKMSVYAHFKDDVNTLLEDDEAKRTNLLGRGSLYREGLYVSAYHMNHGGRDYAVKVGGYVHHNLRAFRRGASIDHIAHLEAVDPDKEVTVMDRIPGRRLDLLTFDQKMAIPTEHIKAAVSTVVAMDKVGLEIDAHPGNLLYDSAQGFGMIDYAAKPLTEPWPNYKSLANQVMAWSNMFVLHSAVNGGVPGRGTQEYTDWELMRGEEAIRLTDKFLDVLERDYPDILDEAVLQDEKPVSGSYIHLPQGQYLNTFRARLHALGFASE